MFDDDKTRGQEPGFYRLSDFGSREASASDGREATHGGGDDHDKGDSSAKAEAREKIGALQETETLEDVSAQDDAQNEEHDFDFGPDEPEAPQGEIDQVREILFGGAQRATEQRLRELEESLGALRSDMMRLFADLEARVADGDAAVERRHVMATQGIGSALSEIGAQILKLSGRNSG
jgi:hypothetical protein